MTVPSTIEEKTCKKNDVKARSLLLMALPNEHQLTFRPVCDVYQCSAALKLDFGGNEATKKETEGSVDNNIKIEDASEKAMCAIDGAGILIGVTWQRKKNSGKHGLMHSQILRGLATLEGQIVKYREHEVRFTEEIALLKRSVGSKEYQMGLLRDELEKVKQEKEGFEFKIAKFDKSAKDLSEMLESQIIDKSKKGVGLEEFKEPEVNEYGPRDSSLKPITDCDKESDNSKENTDDSLEQHQITDTETSPVKSSLKIDKDWKEKFFYTAKSC
ncbi:hypothetical protein Tco_1538356 [Tanacetum coccineum]